MTTRKDCVDYDRLKVAVLYTKTHTHTQSCTTWLRLLFIWLSKLCTHIPAGKVSSSQSGLKVEFGLLPFEVYLQRVPVYLCFPLNTDAVWVDQSESGIPHLLSKQRIKKTGKQYQLQMHCLPLLISIPKCDHDMLNNMLKMSVNCSHVKLKTMAERVCVQYTTAGMVLISRCVVNKSSCLINKHISFSCQNLLPEKPQAS